MFVWDVATGNTTRRIAGHMAKINAVEFNEDATVVASGAFQILGLCENEHNSTLQVLMILP